ncbi:PASTA domain-containing protein [Dactylosporangium matsuzakiense]|uniref:PASTA domain-containing protein n=1 Tax=Dactylosporangium matsuzakiense TaxID=53360 RepID=UPI0021C306D5|nr:PASTA domain-containing protein [Dactylosporangium matsuzakiense]UWZ41186.1 PASTA domain-containing protein [Dactylosporangium matsuzakiense]
MRRNEASRLIVVVAACALVLSGATACEPQQGERSGTLPGYAKPPNTFADVLAQSDDRSVSADAHSLSRSGRTTSARVTDSLAQGVAVHDGDVQVTAHTSGAGSGQTAARGVVVFRDAATATDIAQQVVAPEAVRILYVIKGSSAPAAFETTFAGATPRLAHGGVELARDGKTVGALTPPWAYDADGTAVPSHYEVSGDRVRLVVEHRGRDVTYPVVADPMMALGSGGRLIGAQLLGGVFEWAAVGAITWGVVKFDSNGCLTLSTFASCLLHPLQHDWGNPAKPKADQVDAAMPALTGVRLPDAQHQLNALKLRNVHLVDDTGQNRTVYDPKNWVVTSQRPAAGTTVHANTELTLRVRKPSDGTGGGAADRGTVPGVICMNLQEAQDRLRSAGYRTESRDSGPDHRRQVLDRNWLVVAQDPAPAATAAAGATVTLDVVKYGEPTGSSGCKS